MASGHVYGLPGVSAWVMPGEFGDFHDEGIIRGSSADLRGFQLNLFFFIVVLLQEQSWAARRRALGLSGAAST